jgi:hypothetical protein
MQGADLPVNLGGVAVVVVNDLLYVLGGYATVYNNLPFTVPDITQYRTVYEYTPFGYGTVPPVVSILTVQNMATYASSDMPLNFSLNKPAVWASYSLDSKDNVTISGNSTLTGLSAGLHNITVYSKDENGNIGASETITFNVASAPFPIVPVVTVTIVLIAIVCVSVILYLKKHKS